MEKGSLYADSSGAGSRFDSEANMIRKRLTMTQGLVTNGILKVARDTTIGGVFHHAFMPKLFHQNSIFHGANITLPPLFMSNIQASTSCRIDGALTAGATNIVHVDSTDANTLFEAGDDLWAASTQIGGLVRLGKIKAISPITNATCDLTNADATVTCDATDLIYVGMSVACSTSGFPGSATVASINTGTEGIDVTSFELSANYTGSTAANQTLTFGANSGTDRDIILTSPISDSIANNTVLSKGWKSLLSRTNHFLNAIQEQSAWTGSRVINSINKDLTDKNNQCVAAVRISPQYKKSFGGLLPVISGSGGGHLLIKI